LIQLEKPVGSTVRVQGSYWNEVNARNWSIMMGVSNVTGWLYLIIIGFTAKKAVAKCNQDRFLPLEAVKYLPKDLYREDIRLIDKETAEKIHDYNVQQIYGADGGNIENGQSEIWSGLGQNKGMNAPAPMKMGLSNAAIKKYGEAERDQHSGQGSLRVGVDAKPGNDGFGWSGDKI
jgi:hypothetical protein